mgnify:CR=1 FL=1
MTTRRQLLTTGVALSALAAWPQVRAQAWPARPLRLIVPFIPGSAPDVIARGLSERLTASLSGRS